MAEQYSQYFYDILPSPEESTWSSGMIPATGSMNMQEVPGSIPGVDLLFFRMKGQKIFGFWMPLLPLPFVIRYSILQKNTLTYPKTEA